MVRTGDQRTCKRHKSRGERRHMYSWHGISNWSCADHNCQSLWQHSEPNECQTCARLVKKDGHWKLFDRPCHVGYRFICKRRKTATNQTSSTCLATTNRVEMTSAHPVTDVTTAGQNYVTEHDNIFLFQVLNLNCASVCVFRGIFNGNGSFHDKF